MRDLKRIGGLLFLLGAAAAGTAGCQKASSMSVSTSGSPGTPAGKAAAAGEGPSALKAPGEARVGDRTTCAMHSDAVFTVSASTPKVEHRGRTYYFCCPECAKHFAEHPGDFVK